MTFWQFGSQNLAVAVLIEISAGLLRQSASFSEGWITSSLTNPTQLPVAYRVL
ncbi:MAG: hypothetical protein KME59_15550 [Trichormus sp. ATA11-4-KO1]|nr:hypothetical protein [Trichormus sp. ATA11-4-KO1]